MSDNEIKDFMANIPGSLFMEKAKGINAKIQFLLSGEQGGEWGVEIKDGTIAIEEGSITNPNLIVNADAFIANQILTSELDGMKAFLTGRIKLVGDLALAMKLVNLIK